MLAFLIAAGIAYSFTSGTQNWHIRGENHADSAIEGLWGSNDFTLLKDFVAVSNVPEMFNKIQQCFSIGEAHFPPEGLIHLD